MGQLNSSSGIGTSRNDSHDLDFLHDQIKKHSTTLRQLTFSTYEELENKIQELNELSSKFEDCKGKQLQFEIKEGTGTSILWKATIVIICKKIEPISGVVEKTRQLNLKEFLNMYHTLYQHLNAANTSSHSELIPTSLNTSMLFEPIKSSNFPKYEDEECAICMERKSEVSLPCAHSYCSSCIERWNVDHKTCPHCREALRTTDDTWVFEERPDFDEVATEIDKSLFSK